VLARLDEIPGVAESRVDWTGRRFLLTLDSSANASRVAEDAASTLGEGATVLGDGDTAAAVADLRRGEAWMRAGETLRLSHHEARVLAERYGDEAADAIGLNEGSKQKLVALFESELDRAFERTHAGKGGVAVEDEIAGAVERILASTRGFLSAEQHLALELYLRRFAASRGG
jgi:hypothetical protein